MRQRALTVFAVLALSSSALANGRFPRAGRVLEDPTDPARLVVGATYGMLTTADRGASWHLLCESSFAGVMLPTFDCVFDRVEGGDLLASFGDAMSRAGAPYCDFSRVLGGDMTNRVVDFSVASSSPKDVLAIVTRRGDGGPGVSALARSEDAGKTFVELGAELPSVENFAVTVDSAPSAPSRVYVSGIDGDSQGVLLVSDDGGEHFESRPIPGVTVDGPPYIAAVHPLWPDTVFVRTDGFGDDGFGVRTADDALFVTRDAGLSWQEVVRAGAKLYGFTLSPDGDRVLVGFGDPRDVTVDPGALGIRTAPLDATSVGPFEHVTSEAVSCLRWTPSGLYVCATDFEVGFHLGFRADADLGGGLETFTPLLELPNVLGPLACPDGTTGARCAADWPATCAAFGASCNTAGAGSAGSGGSNAGDAGSGGSSAAGAPAAGGAGAPTPTRPTREGCACRAAGDGSSGALGLLALGAVAAGARYGKQRASRRR